MKENKSYYQYRFKITLSKFNVDNQRKLKEEKDLLRGDQNDKEITPE